MAEMSINEYIESRVDNQINWYDKKSQKCQKWYKFTQIIEIILAASIPLLSGFSTSDISVAIIVGVMGVIITIIESVNKLNKYHENWIEYRATCEMLKYQKNLYLTGSPPYNNNPETIETLFIRNIEQIISSENNQWKFVNLNDKKGEAVNKNKVYTTSS